MTKFVLMVILDEFDGMEAGRFRDFPRRKDRRSLEIKGTLEN
jgi:hypothetical protein